MAATKIPNYKRAIMVVSPTGKRKVVHYDSRVTTEAEAEKAALK